MRVTKTQFPAIYRAFETISHDRGTQAGHLWYEIPDNGTWWKLRLDQVNFALGRLKPEEFETFCIGEVTEKEAITGEDAWLIDADVLLYEFFESDWQGPMIDGPFTFCTFCGEEVEIAKAKVTIGYLDSACESCYSKHKNASREDWKRELGLMQSLLTPLELRARVRECLNVPTVYVPPPTKKERAVSRFELWRDYNEFQAYSNPGRGGGHR
jgi:hypothetical protein